MTYTGSTQRNSWVIGHHPAHDMTDPMSCELGKGITLIFLTLPLAIFALSAQRPPYFLCLLS